MLPTRAYCDFCGSEYLKRYSWQKYCSIAHAYKADNLRRKNARATDKAHEHTMPDVWTENRLPPSVTANRLNFEWAGDAPKGCEPVGCPKTGGEK